MGGLTTCYTLRVPNDAPVWQPVTQGGALFSRIVEQVERLIEARRLEPGDRLPPERELAQLLNVSRPSLREALKALEARGRVRIRHGVGVWIQAGDPGVRLIGMQQIGLRELFSMREVLEVPAAAWAAGAATPDAGARLLTMVDAMDGLVDIEELGGMDVEFHTRITELAGNRFLQQTLGVLHEMLREGMKTTLAIPGRRQRANTEHRRIAEAIAVADIPAARRAMRTHIRSAQSAALRRLADEPAPTPNA